MNIQMSCLRINMFKIHYHIQGSCLNVLHVCKVVKDRVKVRSP